MKYPFAATGQIPDAVLDAMKAAPQVTIKYTVDLPIHRNTFRKRYHRAKRIRTQTGVFDPIHPRYATGWYICLRDDRYGWWTVVEAERIVEYVIHES